MKIQKGSFKTIKNSEPLTITIGNFDGVHLGHQALIKQTKAYTDTKSAVLTFNPHPKKVFGEENFKTLMTLPNKIKEIKSMKVDYLFLVDFKQEFYRITPLEFINFLKSLNVKRVVVGKDYRFGAFASGTVSDLEEHFIVCLIDDIEVNQTRVSSSYLKTVIEEGNISLAEKILTRPYQISGVVTNGNKIGRTLKIPTANLLVDNYVMPPNGVYFVTVKYNNKIYPGALNIGYNPTINRSNNLKVEVHILDFKETIYQEELTITFYQYLRPEQKLNNRDELITTIKNDIITCKKLFDELIIQEKNKWIYQL